MKHGTHPYGPNNLKQGLPGTLNVQGKNKLITFRQYYKIML